MGCERNRAPDQEEADVRTEASTRTVLPVVTAAGIMPGGSEMAHWYRHIPFPGPQVLAAKREALLAQAAAAARTAKRPA